MSVQTLHLDCQRHLFHGLFVFNDLRSDVVVCFVDIGGIVDHHCITFFFNDMEPSNFYFCTFRIKYLMEKQHISKLSV